jgi:Right handed beta helix region
MHRRDFVAGLLCSAALPLGATALTAAMQPAGEAVNVVERFGLVGDGRTDNYEAFHRWAAHVNRVGGGHYVFPPGTYFVRKYRTKSHEIRDPREIINAMIDGARGLTITGYGAKIRLNGAFHRSSRKGPDGREIGLFTATFMPFNIHRSSNVTIKGFEMDGGVHEMTRDPDVAECFAGLIVLQGCTDVLLEDLDLHHSQTDAIYLVSSFEGTWLGGRPSVACRDVTLRNVKCHDNARGGLGVFQVYGLLCEDCAFNDNGAPGRYKPHAPCFGVDVEPDYVKPHVDILTGNIEFRRCEFMDNWTAFLGANRDRYQGYIRLIDCRSSNRRQQGPYHMFLCSEDFLLEGGVHDAGSGMIAASWEGQVGGNVTIRNCEIRTSGLYGVAHTTDGNHLRLENVKIVGTHAEPGAYGQMILIRANPGGGRKNLVRNCEVFVPAIRKSRENLYDYEAILNHTVSEGNLFRTDLPAAGGQHFAVGSDAGGIARGDRFRGTAPGTQDSIRPGHNSSHDTRTPFTSG